MNSCIEFKGIYRKRGMCGRLIYKHSVDCFGVLNIKNLKVESSGETIITNLILLFSKPQYVIK